MKFSSFRWYQFLRPLFVACGARRGGALLGKHGAGIEAFTVSGVLHVLGTWGGVGSGVECHTTGGFFVLTGTCRFGVQAVDGMSRRDVSGLWCGHLVGAGWA